MKLSNLSVIFIVLAIPLILILSYYISLQRDTINMQTSYNTKLLESTKEAIEAFEINTVEWNEAYSETADSKRRDVMASINTFTTALANNLGVSGTSKEYLLSHIPAVAFTLYDGFYIYSPSETKFTVKNKNGVTQFMSEDTAKSIAGYTYRDEDNGKILYEANSSNYDGIYKYEDSYGNDVEKYFTLNPDNAIGTKDYQSQDYPHILKPFTVYSESVTSGTNKMIINYTLDNYLTVYGEIDGEYTSNSGYLNVTSSTITDSGTDNGIYISNNDFANNTLDQIYFSGMHIQPELLSETIAYKEEGTTEIKTGTFNYVYEAEKDTKVYYDSSNGEFFRLNNNIDLERVYIKDLPEPLYKKCTIPTKTFSGEQSYIKAYQSLVDGTWYLRNTTGTYILIEDGDIATQWDEKLYPTDSSSPFYDKLYDYSAINYCVETYIFTNWVNGLALKYADGTQIKIDKTNDPEYQYSTFSEHKREVIKNIVISNLNQAITSYSRKTKEEYRLPMLKETEWDQVLSNVSIITFLQNIPIGLKYYNNYAIATSTFNKEYVDPEEIYIYDKDTSSDLIYHTPYCNKLTTDNDLIGYRSIDYMYKDYEKSDEEKGYYFKHTDNSNSRQVNQSCYYCLVQRALYEENITDKKKDAYYTSLARERYLQLDSITIEKSDINVTKTVNKTEVSYGDIVKYTITITNDGSVNDYISIRDIFKKNQLELLITAITVNGKTSTYSEEEYAGEIYSSLIWEGLEIGALGQPNSTIKIEFEARVIGGNIGENITNTVGVYSYSTSSIELANASVSSKITKKIIIEPTEYTEDLNVIMALDNSSSMIGKETSVRDAAERFANILSNQEIEVFAFEQKTRDIEFKTKANGEKELQGYNTLNARLGTNYLAALYRIKESHISDDKKNIIIFMTDGCPTATQNKLGTDPDSSVFEGLGLDVVGVIEAIGGGWMELAWTGNEQYKFSLMVTDTIPWILQLILGEINAEILYPDILGISKHVWKNMIMPQVNDIKDTGAEIYSVYYNTSNSNGPAYGLEQIASASGEKEYYYNASDANQLAIVFEQIASDIRGTNIAPDTFVLAQGEIQLEQVSQITKIKVGTNEYGIDTFIDKINVDTTTDVGILNLNDFPTIFHREGDITVVY